MRKSLLIVLCSLSVTLISAQDQVIRISNDSSDKEVIIKDNRRVKIKTSHGQKIAGRLGIQQGDSIMIDEKRIAIADIQEIKRNLLRTSIFSSGFFIYAGALTIGIGVIGGVLVDSTVFLAAIPGAGLIYTSSKSPNFHRKYKRDKNWTFEPAVAP